MKSCAPLIEDQEMEGITPLSTGSLKAYSNPNLLLYGLICVGSD